ncbi:hypothetical protein yc1106_02763 [Curvularia clavata]|uniref:C2H2-type domain-containing protein n=1 Tax=Curvularia clavata TaxID=95742 RepID=A0A9Q9DR91_CURCL|nr:hypothetical protein yc1106_02763 [Curvularia clavata]
MTLEIFKCNACAKSCDTRGKLNRHMKTHSKPFRCDACSGGFALRSDLERHIKARHRVGNDQYRCPDDQCWRTFKRNDNLKRHVRKWHPSALLSVKSSTSIADATTTVSLPQDVEISLAVSSLNGIYSVSIFMQAATSGNIATLELLMSFGFTLDTKAGDESTALHCAARSGQAKTVQYLLDKGADVNAKNKSGRIPLHEGFLSSDLDTVKAFIEHIPNEQDLSERGETDRFLAQTRNIKILELYVRLSKARSEIWFDVNGYDGKHSPIHYAARYGNAKSMEILLASDRVNKSHTTKYTRRNALHIAAWNGHPNIVEQLLHLDFDVESLDVQLRTPLHLAAMHGYLEVVKLLVEKWKADISSSDKYGGTPLHLAAFGGHWKCVHVLLGSIASRNDRDILDIQSENKDFVKKDVVTRLLNTAAFGDPNMRYRYREGNTLLHWLVQKGDIEAIEVLLAHDKIDVNAINDSFYSPLRLAVEYCQIEAARLLIQHPQINVNQKALGWGGTALSRARAFGYQEMVDLLLSYGAKDEEAGDAPTIAMEDGSSLATVKAGQIPNTPLQLQHEFDPEFDSEILMDGIPAVDDNSDAEDGTGIF